MSTPIIGRYEVTFNHKPTVDELVKILSQLPKEAVPQFETVDVFSQLNEPGTGLRISAEAPLKPPKPESHIRKPSGLPPSIREY